MFHGLSASAFFLSLLPSGFERYLVAAGAVTGVVLDFLFGSGWHGESFLWLVVLMIADWISGVSVAIHEGRVSSEAGFIGLLRKGVCFCVIAVAHAFDVAAGVELAEAAVVLAYVVNEGVSVVENLASLGYDKYIPAPILAALESAREESEERLKSITRGQK